MFGLLRFQIGLQECRNMFAKCYILFMWFSSSFCVIIHDPTTLDLLGTLGPANVERHDLELSLNLENCPNKKSKKLTATNEAPVLNPVQQTQGDKQSAITPEKSSVELDLSLGLGSSQRKRKNTNGKHPPVTTAKIGRNRESGIALLKEYFVPNLRQIDETTKCWSIHGFLEVVGIEIMKEFKIITKTDSYDSPQFEALRKNIQSHTVKSLVGYIYWINKISNPPLYDNPEKLQSALQLAVVHLEEFWSQLVISKRGKSEIEPHSTDPLLSSEIQHGPLVAVGNREELWTRLDASREGESQIKAHSTMNPFLSSEENPRKIKDSLEDSHFSIKSSNAIASGRFILWLRQNSPTIHSHVSQSDDPFVWRTGALALIHCYILASKSSDEVLSQIPIQYVQSRPFLGRCLSYTATKEFTLRWSA